MVIDPRILQQARPPRRIDEPRPCRYCGYDLRGLMDDGNCPECGKPIRPKREVKFSEDNLTQAPPEYLRLLTLGANLMMAGWLGLAVGILVLAVRPDANFAVIYAASGLAWWIGVTIVARPRPATPATTENRANEWLGLRLGCRITQAFWVLSGGLAVAGTSGGPAWALDAALVAFVVASVGLVPVCLFVSNLGYWAADTTVAIGLSRLSVLVAFMPLCLGFISGGLIPSALAILGGPQSPIVLIMLVLLVVLAIPAGLFTWLMWNFRQDAAWAVANYQEADAKERRFIERSEAQAGTAPLPDNGVDPAALPGFRLGSSEVPPPATPRLHAGNRAKGILKKKSGELNPYDLAEGDP